MAERKINHREYADGKVSQEFVIETDEAVMTIDAVGGHITSWKVRNPKNRDTFIDVLYTGTEKKRSGIPVLFPNYGESKTVGTHGFGRNSLWIPESGSDKNKMELSLSDSGIDSEDAKKYPHLFAANIGVTLTDSSLTYNLQVQNTGHEVLPISPGLHPYFAVPHEEKHYMMAKGMMGFDPYEIDWDGAPPDTVYPFKNKVTVQFPDKELEIKDVTRSQKPIQHIVVWSQNTDKPDSDFVCFEPVCGLDHGLENSPIQVAPQDTWNMALRFSVKV